MNAPEPGIASGRDWSFDQLQRSYDRIEKIALHEMGLNVYPNQIEVITSEQMLDAYSSIGLPLMYRHWSFGKRFARDETLYRNGQQGLAYEIVINSDPCIVYIMEENSMAMQALVMAHAAFGHNHFFKNNALFRQWTDAGGILDYMDFAKSYISRCEERYGEEEVERLLDAAHALMTQGVSRYPRRNLPTLQDEARREAERRAEAERTFNDLWRTLPSRSGAASGLSERAGRQSLLGLPEENILYFLEKKAPLLKDWQREILRIVRHVAQYFYPQKQTRLMNEGCATWTHYSIMNRLHEQGFLQEGAFLEFLHSHTSVVFQPDFDDRRYSGINPYALGFAMMEDIVRICENPDEEDRAWFPDIAGNKAGLETLKEAWENYRDESFIRQFLSPRLIRKLKLFALHDDSRSDLLVRSIHNERGYRSIRSTLADQFDTVRMEPELEVVDVDLVGDRRLILQHRVHNGILLESGDTTLVLQRLADLWGYEVRLEEIDAVTNAVLQTHEAGSR
ncbi:Stage V sporulation protein R [Granulibacter bethesdensis]|uniref:Stage V sporulation protein R n=1 Tax=Granulibacter bethesdensis TaxID=364410 RepID=A0AAN0RCI3_9PROT|nr:SpoVR family protein [Granulibacter bethesdensis]AHJ62279.1 Stage V sporulation protein R [Granulibacter bethesdensis]